MELSLNTARDMLAPLFENSNMLPRDIFDYKNQMHDNVSVCIRRSFPLIKEELLSFITEPLKDIVCYGSLCSSIHHSNSWLNVAFVVDTSLPDETLACLGLSLKKRGLVFKIYNHPISFSVVKPKNVISSNWSIMYNRWNKEPQFQNFSYDLDFFLEEYMKLNNSFHAALDDLPKNKDGIYTPESCAKIKAYFDDLEQKAKDALLTAPEHEYSLAYNLWLALDIFNVREHFFIEIAKSESYYLSGDINENI